jgi:hypothetical protein
MKPNIMPALSSARSDISTTSLSKTIERSSDWCDLMYPNHTLSETIVPTSGVDTPLVAERVPGGVVPPHVLNELAAA